MAFFRRRPRPRHDDVVELDLEQSLGEDLEVPVRRDAAFALEAGMGPLRGAVVRVQEAPGGWLAVQHGEREVRLLPEAQEQARQVVAASTLVPLRVVAVVSDGGRSWPSVVFEGGQWTLYLTVLATDPD